MGKTQNTAGDFLGESSLSIQDDTMAVHSVHPNFPLTLFQPPSINLFQSGCKFQGVGVQTEFGSSRVFTDHNSFGRNCYYVRSDIMKASVSIYIMHLNTFCFWGIPS